MHKAISKMLKTYDKDKYNGILISFGCSWTFGTGLHYFNGMNSTVYFNGMNSTVYEKDALDPDIADEYSFRALLARKHGLYNLNFAEGGSSNHRQFRFARELFASPYAMDLLHSIENVNILWGITSTARMDQWDTTENKYINFMYNDMHDGAGNSLFNKMFVKRTYDHDAEVIRISEYINLWNGFFSHHNFNNLWFDTFNTHDYPYSIANLVHDNVMNHMLQANIDENDSYHESIWLKNDDPRLDTLVDIELLNPHSYHPTKLGHKKIVEILTPYVENLIKNKRTNK